MQQAIQILRSRGYSDDRISQIGGYAGRNGPRDVQAMLDERCGNFAGRLKMLQDHVARQFGVDAAQQQPQPTRNSNSSSSTVSGWGIDSRNRIDPHAPPMPLSASSPPQQRTGAAAAATAAHATAHNNSNTDQQPDMFSIVAAKAEALRNSDMQLINDINEVIRELSHAFGLDDQAISIAAGYSGQNAHRDVMAMSEGRATDLKERLQRLQKAVDYEKGKRPAVNSSNKQQSQHATRTQHPPASVTSNNNNANPFATTRTNNNVDSAFNNPWAQPSSAATASSTTTGPTIIHVQPYQLPAQQQQQQQQPVIPVIINSSSGLPPTTAHQPIKELSEAEVLAELRQTIAALRQLGKPDSFIAETAGYSGLKANAERDVAAMLSGKAFALPGRLQPLRRELAKAQEEVAQAQHITAALLPVARDAIEKLRRLQTLSDGQISVLAGFSGQNGYEDLKAFLSGVIVQDIAARVDRLVKAVAVFSDGNSDASVQQPARAALPQQPQQQKRGVAEIVSEMEKLAKELRNLQENVVM